MAKKGNVWLKPDGREVRVNDSLPEVVEYLAKLGWKPLSIVEEEKARAEAKAKPKTKSKV